MFEKKHLRKQLDTIVGPQSKHTIVDQGCSWTTPVKNCLYAAFFGGFNKVSDNLGSCAFLRISNERNEESKRKKL